jgi:hypothetical protein
MSKNTRTIVPPRGVIRVRANDSCQFSDDSGS